jgi:DNA-binding MarR family transcriptional regulator
MIDRQAAQTAPAAGHASAPALTPSAAPDSRRPADEAAAHPKRGANTLRSRKDAQPLTASPPHNDAARRVEAIRTLARATRVLERASGELSLAHYRVLAAIAAGDQRASRVAERLAIGKPTVSVAVDALVLRGLLVRSEVDGDHRVAALNLTPEGEALLLRVEGEMLRRFDDLCARTPDAAALVQSLIWLGAAVDDAQAQRAAARRGV